MRNILFPKFAVLGLLYVTIGRPQDILVFLKSLHLGVIFGALTVFSMVAFSAYSPKKPTNLFSEHKWLFCLIGLMLVNTLLSRFPGHGVDFLMEYAKTLVLYLGMNALLHSKEDFRRVAIIFLASGLTLSSSIVLKGVRGISRTDVSQLAGTFYDPNDLAMIMTITLPFVFFLQSTSKGLTKGFAIFATFPILATIVSTSSRMGFLSIIVLGVIYLFRGLHLRFQLFKKGGIIFAAFLIVSFFGSQAYWDRIQSTFEKGNTGSGRTVVWKRALEISKENIILGVGPGAFASVYGRKLRAGEFELVGDSHVDLGWKTAHNTYILALVELGYPGLISFLALIWVSLRRLRYLSKEARNNEKLFPVFVMSRSVEMAFDVFLFCIAFLSKLGSSVLLVLLSLGMLISKIRQVEVLEKEGEKSSDLVFQTSVYKGKSGFPDRKK